MKLALGTAQFGFNYGIANTMGQVSIIEAEKIIEKATAHGINTLDTAIAYEQSETVLGNIGLEDWKVVTKLPSIPENISNIHQWIEQQILSSLKRLKICSIYGLLLHNPNQLLGKHHRDILNALLSIKSKGLVKKIGVSIYSPDELATLFEIHNFDIVQAPLNILDQRLVLSGWAEKLNKEGVEIHSRSSFLQGLLLMTDENRPKKFNRWKNIWASWQEWLTRNQITALQACLLYCLSIKTIDKVIVGVDSPYQLDQILHSTNLKLNNFPTWPEYYDEKLLNPGQWSQL